MSNPLHPMVRRSERGPRADTAGGKDPSSGSDGQPFEMESHLTSSETTTESQSTDSADELTEPVTVEMASSSVNGSPGVEMGLSGDAIPVPEVEPEDPTKANTSHVTFTANTPDMAQNDVCRLYKFSLRLLHTKLLDKGTQSYWSWWYWSFVYQCGSITSYASAGI